MRQAGLGQAGWAAQERKGEREKIEGKERKKERLGRVKRKEERGRKGKREKSF
jgi:hypothetical protein